MKSRWLFGICGAALIAVGCSQTDAGITASVKSKLIGDNQVQARQINVDTKDHVVTLTGQVRSAEEQSRAVQLARETNGVTQVVDQLAISPTDTAPTTGRAEETTSGTVAEKAREGADKTRVAVSKTGELITDAWITTKVKSSFVGDDLLQGSDINVDTNDHVVTLKGTVLSAPARARAVEVAKGIEGVRDVVDHLTIGSRATGTSPNTTKPGSPKPRY